MQVRELANGLWYWTGRHPGWTPASGGVDGWDQGMLLARLEKAILARNSDESLALVSAYVRGGFPESDLVQHLAAVS